MKKFIAIVQARMTSIRLPGKILKKVKDKYILEYVIERVRSSKCDDIIVCTTVNREDDPVAEFCQKRNVRFFRGDENDVLGRFYNALKNEKNSTAVRITSDNPLVDPYVIDYMINLHIKHKNSVTTNYFSDTFPNGTIVSLIDFDVLRYMNDNDKEPCVREHIVFGFEKLPKHFAVESVIAPEKWHRPDIKFAIDYQEDLELFSKIADKFKITGNSPDTVQIIRFIDKNKGAKTINDEVVKRWKNNAKNYSK
jgi:spore coat polysaccharide biosynthesis protein SpsF